MKDVFLHPRRQVRLEFNLPARVRGRESLECEWTELTQLVNATQIGARFLLTRPTEPGRVLQVISGLPSQLRCFDFHEAQYRIWAYVTNVRYQNVQGPEPFRAEVGVAFIGPHAPAGYETNPAQLYELIPELDGGGLWRVRERLKAKPYQRPETRHPIALEVELQPYGAKGLEPEAEITVTENLSRTGAAVFTMGNMEPGRFVRLTSRQHKVSIIAAVRGRHYGEDSRIRVHLEFVDRKWPLEGVEAG